MLNNADIFRFSTVDFGFPTLFGRFCNLTKTFFFNLQSNIQQIQELYTAVVLNQGARGGGLHNKTSPMTVSKYKYSKYATPYVKYIVQLQSYNHKQSVS